jgi:hypothetical protein
LFSTYADGLQRAVLEALTVDQCKEWTEALLALKETAEKYVSGPSFKALAANLNRAEKSR